MIHVEHLKKHFGPVHAVDDVSFDIARGEVVGLLGPNGAGKTTTMRIITGFLSPDAGAVTVDGIPVSSESIATRKRIGYLPESAPLYDDMETSEYLEYISKLSGVRTHERREAIRDMVEVCGLGPVLGRRIGELSKGFRQRTGLAAAMIHRPPILILDEPTSGLDPNQIVEIRNLIKEIGRERTVILSTHILQEVEATCSRAFVINAGKLAGQGTIEELRSRTMARAHYRIALRAARPRIESALEKLPDVTVDEWLSPEAEERQRVMLRCNAEHDMAENIFNWAKDAGFALSELVRESASLEDAFRELTRNS